MFIHVAYVCHTASNMTTSYLHDVPIMSKTNMYNVDITSEKNGIKLTSCLRLFRLSVNRPGGNLGNVYSTTGWKIM